MKNLKYILILILGVLVGSCSLDEDPIFLDATLYDNSQSASAALDGIYQNLTDYGAQEQRYFVINGFSGLFNTNKNGGVTNTNNENLFSLKPVYDNDSEAMWGGLYSVIAQTNAAIQNINVVEPATTFNENLFNDIAGQAYFVRAWSYFSLVRLFGDIPLWLELPSSGNLNKAKSPAKDVYAQTIKDAQKASELMNGTRGTGYPLKYAAHMLLAKLYMTLATNPDLHDGTLTEMDYWQMAYDAAIQVYGKYSLVSDYSSLFTDTNENTEESIFELQISQDAANSQMGRNFSPWQWKTTQSFGWSRVHADVYDNHANTYPDDPRIEGTYKFEYIRADNGSTIKFYPANASRSTWFNAHPYLFKFAEKDQANTNQYGSQNIVVYRYAELLLMLAEISNELQNGQQLGFVTEVLDRVGLTPADGFYGPKEEFRDAIMNEYRYELLGEGEDSHNNRRRGFAYFLQHTILKHNNTPGFKADVDLTLSTDEAQIMYLPIPLIEINTNEWID